MAKRYGVSRPELYAESLTLNVPTCADGVPTFKGQLRLNEEHVLEAQQWAAARSPVWGYSDELQYRDCDAPQSWLFPSSPRGAVCGS